MGRQARALGIPLYQALGAARSSVRGYASGGWAPGEEAEAELAGYAAKGFTAAKMRVVGRDGFSIANCVRRVKAARRGLDPNVELMIDAHGSLEVATAIKLAKELEPYDIAWFEEPVSPDDHVGQAEVRRSTTIPIASGEREYTRFDFQDLLERRAAQFGPALNRDTVGNVQKAGFRLCRVENVYLDVVKSIEAAK
jgi:D-galactarolactone cycloisomerase